MSQPKQTAVPHTALHDTLGLSMIALGAVFGVCAVMYLKEGPGSDPGAFTSTMSAFIEALGSPAVFWLCLGLLFVGGRLFLFGAERGLVRDLIGFAATALGLSVLMGALSSTLGGHFGNLTGGAASALGTRFLGVALGLGLLLTLAWVFWLRVAPPALVAKATALIGEDPAPETAAAPGEVRAGRSAPARKQPTEDPHGVSSAEADALLPDADRDQILHALRTANRNSATTANHAPSPYPTDVRREGGIPSGARPIESANDPRPAARPVQPAATPPVAVRPASAEPRVDAGRAAPLQPRTAPKPVAGPVGAGGDLARNADARGAVEPARPPTAAAGLTPPKAAAPIQTPPPAARPGAGSAKVIPIPASSGPIGSPTWESDEELTEPVPLPSAVATPAPAAEPLDAEVVDAYGTPLDLVAALREQADEEQLEDESVPEESDEDVAVPLELAADLDDFEDEDEVADDDEAVPATIATWEASEEDADEDLEGPAPAQDEAEEPDEVVATQPVRIAAVAPQMDEDEDEDEVEGKERQAQLAQTGDPLPEVLTRVETAARAEREVVLQPVQNSLFDTEPKPAASAVPPKAKAPKERTVVLDPQPAAAELAPTVEGDDLVYRCGLLFLEKQRVAVSMLQREFSLDFKQATAVLDQLQEQGLIGPYLGGQRRDILLTAEEWRAKTGALS